MNTTNRRLLIVASIIALLYIGAHAYLVYNKFVKDNWLSSLDITTFLIDPGDLPSGYSPGKINTLKPDDFSKFVQGKEQEILAPDGSLAGRVRIYLFSIKDEQEEMFNLQSLMETPEGMIPLDVDNIGEKQLAAIDPFGLIVFTRCTAIGYVQVGLYELEKGYEIELLIAHAKRLDDEIKSIACERP